MLSFPYVEAWLSANKTYLRMILWPIVVLLLLMDVLSDVMAHVAGHPQFLGQVSGITGGYW